jgi:DNA polymerase I-like protein with 3'-5' exonuclease and polymerase domains
MPGEDYNGKVRKFVNTPVQATASDLTMAAFVLVYDEVEELALDVRYVGFVHDSIMLEVRDDHVEAVAEIVKHAMENPMLDELHLSLPVPLRADVEVGDNWADAKELVFA